MNKIHNETFPYNVLMEEKGKQKIKERKNQKEKEGIT